MNKCFILQILSTDHVVAMLHSTYSDTCICMERTLDSKHRCYDFPPPVYVKCGLCCQQFCSFMGHSPVQQVHNNLLDSHICSIAVIINHHAVRIAFKYK